MNQPVRALFLASFLAAGALLLGACGSASDTATSSAAATPSSAENTSTGDGAVAPTAVAPSNSPSVTPTATPAPATLEPPKVAGVTWKPVGRTVHGQHAVYVAHVANDTVGLMWMNPQLLKFRYIPGTKYPENSPTRPQDTKPSSWVPRMVAAFNGGFHLKDDLGGYFYAGHMVKPMENGRAVFVVKNDGSMSVGVWGKDITSTSGDEVVRQNMRPLVLKGKSQATADDDPGHWGLANGGLPHASRSALAQLADGSLVFAYGYEVLAATMGKELTKVGARTAVMLDMNKSWPMGFYYSKPGSSGQPAGHPVLPTVMRDASSYYEQFSKDFVVALAP